MTKPKIAIYSCYFGQHEPFNRDVFGSASDADRIIFTDHESLVVPETRIVFQPSEDPKIASRIPKLCPHRFLSNYDWVIYLDNNAQLSMQPQEIVERASRGDPSGARAGRYLFLHRNNARRDAFKELRLAHAKGKTSFEEFQPSQAVFSSLNMPRGGDLYVNTAMVQKMGDQSTDELNETWLELFSQNVKRDQIWLPVAIHKVGIQPKLIEDLDIADIIRWPIFKRRHRLNFQSK